MKSKQLKPVRTFSATLFIGLRYLRARRAAWFASFLTMLSVLGIALGVIILIVVVSIMNGFQAELRERLLGLASHLVVHTVVSEAEQLDPVYAYLVQANQVKSVDWYMETDIIASRATSVAPAVLRAYNSNLSALTDLLISPLQVDANFSADADPAVTPDGIYMGVELANALSVGVGEVVSLVVPIIQPDGAGVVPRMQEFRVLALIKADVPQYDGSLILIPYNLAHNFLSGVEAQTGYRIMFANDNLAFTFAEQIRHQYPSVQVQTWAEMHQSFFAAIKIEKVVMFIILLLIIAVAAFNIISTLAVTVAEKQSDIAILMTLGATPAMIRSIFLVQGIVVGVSGTVLGLLLGVPAALFFPEIIGTIEWLLGFKVFSPDIFYISEIPSRVICQDVVAVTLFSLITSVIATLHPSWRASSIEPAAALRYE